MRVMLYCEYEAAQANLEQDMRYAPPTCDLLTANERRVLSLAADGYRPCDIANRMSTSVNEANDHIYHVLVKLGVRSIEEAVVLHYQRPPSRRETADAGVVG